MIFSQYTDKSLEEVLNILETSALGLSKKEAVLRQKKFGLNEFKIKNINGLQILIRQFKSPFFYLLFIAAFISILVGQPVDSVAIIIFIFVNVIVGFFQEYKAEKSIIILQKFIPLKTKVIRDGKEEIIDEKLLVPGDIVLLEAGDTAPADLRAIILENFLADESALTGESSPVPKIKEKVLHEEKEIFKAKNIIFSGTSVISGKVQGVVVAIGKSSVFGGILKSVSEIKRESAYEKSILYFSKLVLKVVTITILLIFAANIALKGISDIWELLLFSVALIVSILPEALPAVVTFAMSEGSMKLARQKVVVKRLSAIEDLGNIEVLCTDKTGTLTQNKLSLEKAVSSDRDKCFLYGILSSGSAGYSLKNAKQTDGKTLNPFDAALFQRATQDILSKAKKFKVISERPFDSYRMMSSFLLERDSKGSAKDRFLIVKGAPESVLKNCSHSQKAKFKETKEDIAREGEEGKRVLAIAFKKMPKDKSEITAGNEKGLTFLGYFVFEDPLKSTAKEAIELSKKLGVQIKIITGDSKEVALYNAKKTGLASRPDDVVSGQQLLEMLPDDFDYACQEKPVFARISPDIKHKIIKSLQKKYEVGFLGEGINDAPALKASDVGIAVAEASDVGREAADVVLLQKDLRVIINGIKEGRMIFSNINKYIKSALASNIGNFYSIAVISLFINFLPMLPVQILLGNLLSDFPLIAIATDSVDVEELRKPKSYQLHNILSLIITLAMVSTVFDFIFFAMFYKQPPANMQTLWFVESILTEIVLIFAIRTRGVFYKAKRPGFWLIFFTIVDGIAIIILPFLKFSQDWFHFVTPPLVPLLMVFFLVGLYFIASEFVKLVYFRYWKPKDSVIS